MSGISQGMGRKNAEMGKAHFSLKKSQKIVKSVFFFTPILGEDYKNVVFPRCVIKDIVYNLPDTFKTLSATIVEHLRVFF